MRARRTLWIAALLIVALLAGALISVIPLETATAFSVPTGEAGGPPLSAQWAQADPITDGFDYPIGKPDGASYSANGYSYMQWVPDADGVYVYHPGVDWNRLCSGVDCDYGDPVYAVANGVIVDARYFSNGFGNVVLIRHSLPDGTELWSQYAHLSEFTNAVVGQPVARGQQIGRIGKGANNMFGAHLHFELRTQYRTANAWVQGWSEDKVRQYYTDPIAFIDSHRAGRLEWDVAGGRFYTQAGVPGQRGFAVTNEGGIAFWSEFNWFGGVQAVGYPVSDRFVWNGFVSQAFQRVVFQWRPERSSAYFVNVFDLLHEAGRDDWLTAARQTPKPLGPEFDAGLSYTQAAQKRLALLDANKAIKTQYNSIVGDPVQMNGLPTSPVTDMGNNYTLRCQRVVIQQWKEDVPWAARGQVTVANGGDIAKESSLLPASATDPRWP